MSSGPNPALCQSFGPELKSTCDKVANGFHNVCTRATAAVERSGFSEHACDATLEVLSEANKVISLGVKMIPNVNGSLVDEISKLIDGGLGKAQNGGWCKELSGTPQSMCADLEGWMARAAPPSPSPPPASPKLRTASPRRPSSSWQ